MRMQIGKFQLITAFVYFAAAVNILWTMFSDGRRPDENLASGGFAAVCLVSGILLLMGRLFPLRIMSATLFLMATLSLFMFSGFDESGLPTVNKIVIATVGFSVAGMYLFFLKRFEAAVARKQPVL